jgi:membrane-bound lytic murein transglycosylase
MTAAWSKGCRRHYAYYLCDTRGCQFSWKSIPRAKIEDGFAEIMMAIQPTQQVVALVREMISDAWASRSAQAREVRNSRKSRRDKIESDIKRLVALIVASKRQAAIDAYESQIEALEREKAFMVDRSTPNELSEAKRQNSIELAVDFLSRPWDI